MKLIILLSNRLIKVFANLLKALCYIFHIVLPKKRFRLPEHSLPIIKRKRKKRIPKIIWQTNYTYLVTLPVYLNYLFNRLLAPTFEYRYTSTEKRAEFIKNNYSKEIFDAYSRLQIGASQADFWRVLTINKLGGVYMDIDANLIWPLELILSKAKDDFFVTSTKGNITNYFFASKPSNPRLEKIIDCIAKNIKENKIKDVYQLTGPGVFDSILDKTEVKARSYRYVCGQGNFTNEYFQYVDKPEGKWTKQQTKIDIVKPEN